MRQIHDDVSAVLRLIGIRYLKVSKQPGYVLTTQVVCSGSYDWLNGPLQRAKSKAGKHVQDLLQ